MHTINQLVAQVPIAFGIVTGMIIIVIVELWSWSALRKVSSLLKSPPSLPKITSLQRARAYTILIKNGYCTKHLIPKVVADYTRDGEYLIECTRCTEEQEARAKDRKLAKARRVTEVIETIKKEAS